MKNKKMMDVFVSLTIVFFLAEYFKLLSPIMILIWLILATALVIYTIIVIIRLFKLKAVSIAVFGIFALIALLFNQKVGSLVSFDLASPIIFLIFMILAALKLKKSPDLL